MPVVGLYGIAFIVNRFDQDALREGVETRIYRSVNARQEANLATSAIARALTSEGMMFTMPGSKEIRR